MLALMQGGAAVSKDVPPFTIASGYNGLCGLNSVGLRRAGFTVEQRLELKQLYHHLFRRQGAFSAALASARTRFHTPGALLLLDFAGSGKRGVCADPGTRVAARREREPAGDPD
jgi:UDP-N-acetylglucosamine acyltransferase